MGVSAGEWVNASATIFTGFAVVGAAVLTVWKTQEAAKQESKERRLGVVTRLREIASIFMLPIKYRHSPRNSSRRFMKKSGLGKT